MNPYLAVMIGTGLTFSGTILGASVVFLLKKEAQPNIQRLFLGFAAGVMIAASIWSLLLPSMNMAVEQGIIKWIPAAIGFAIGGVFLLILDITIPHLHFSESKPEGVKSSFKRTTLLVFAVTLHNIPEGMAVGLTFALGAQQNNNMTLTAALALAIGMALQNFPEGASISLPLRNEGYSRRKAFVMGALSGIVEPIAGIVTVFIIGTIKSFLPYLLAFAAGAMIYVVVEELIPQSQTDKHSNLGTLGALVGFIIMMILDVALG